MNISMSMSSIQLERKLMKTIKLTDDQFNTLFNRIDKIAKTIIDASVEYQNSDMLNEWEDLLDVHSVLEEANKSV